jgi:hypothetical protein
MSKQDAIMHSKLQDIQIYGGSKGLTNNTNFWVIETK